MSKSFNERQALHMTLQSLLEQRISLRKEFVDRDKELGQEIKQVLNRIRELDEKYGIPVCSDEQEGETISQSTVPENKDTSIKRAGKTRRPYHHYDYPGIAREIEKILEEASAPLTLTELYNKLQQCEETEWSSPYIVIQKALKHSDRVKVDKEGRKLMFSIQ